MDRPTSVLDGTPHPELADLPVVQVTYATAAPAPAAAATAATGTLAQGGDALGPRSTSVSQEPISRVRADFRLSPRAQQVVAAYQAAVCTYQRLDALRSLQVKASDSHIGPRVWLCPLMTAVQYVNEEEVLPGLAHLFPTELDVIRGDAIAHLVVFVVPVGLLHDFARVVARAATDKWRYLFVALDCGTLPPSIACETMQQFAESQSFPCYFVAPPIIKSVFEHHTIVMRGTGCLLTRAQLWTQVTGLSVYLELKRLQHVIKLARLLKRSLRRAGLPGAGFWKALYYSWTGQSPGEDVEDSDDHADDDGAEGAEGEPLTPALVYCKLRDFLEHLLPCMDETGRKSHRKAAALAESLLTDACSFAGIVCPLQAFQTQLFMNFGQLTLLSGSMKQKLLLANTLGMRAHCPLFAPVGRLASFSRQARASDRYVSPPFCSTLWDAIWKAQAEKLTPSSRSKVGQASAAGAGRALEAAASDDDDASEGVAGLSRRPPVLRTTCFGFVYNDTDPVADPKDLECRGNRLSHKTSQDISVLLLFARKEDPSSARLKRTYQVWSTLVDAARKTYQLRIDGAIMPVFVRSTVTESSALASVAFLNTSVGWDGAPCILLVCAAGRQHLASPRDVRAALRKLAAPAGFTASDSCEQRKRAATAAKGAHSSRSALTSYVHRSGTPVCRSLSDVWRHEMLMLYRSHERAWKRKYHGSLTIEQALSEMAICSQLPAAVIPQVAGPEARNYTGARLWTCTATMGDDIATAVAAAEQVLKGMVREVVGGDDDSDEPDDASVKEEEAEELATGGLGDGDNGEVEVTYHRPSSPQRTPGSRRRARAAVESEDDSLNPATRARVGSGGLPLSE